MSVELPEVPADDNDSDLDLDLSTIGVTEEPTSQPQETSQENEQSTEADNPAWATILESIPESLHGILKPKLKDWDRGVNTRFQKIHDEYQPYKAYEPLVKQGVPVDELSAALNAVRMLESNPLDYYNKLGEYLRSTGALAPNEKLAGEDSADEDDIDEDDPTAAKIAQLERQQKEFLDNISRQTQQAQAAAQEKEMDEQIDREYNALEEKHGKFSPLVREQIFNTALLKAQRENRYVPLDEAFKDVQALITSIRQAPRPGSSAPRIPSSGGGTPAPAVPDGGFKSDAERKSAATEFLRNLVGRSE